MIIYRGEQNKTELLSPAGGMEALYAAVQNGADAVYLGSDRFSARASAKNFNDEELKSAISYCKVRGVKTYLAINTLIGEDEMESALSLAAYAAGIGIDALIVQDIGFARAVSECIPTLPLHASTQMTVHSLSGVRFLEERGFSRVVLSRELTREEIEYIVKNCKAEIEVFVHGALCVCYSGKCLLSSVIGGRSGNRGSCAQPCRLPVKIGERHGYLMSMYDLSLAKEVDELSKMGVASLKIEGRMKSGEYVATVTDAFRKIIDTKSVTPETSARLKDIFCRGGKFTKGYYESKKGGEMINSRASNDKIAHRAPRELLKWAEQSFRQGLENKKIAAEVELAVGKSIALTMRAMGKTATVYTEGEDAPPLDEGRIKAQLSKLGQTPLFAETISVLADECNIKISTLNSLRRECADMLLSKIAKPPKMEILPYKEPYTKKALHKKSVSVSVLTSKQLSAALDSRADRIYIPLALFGGKLPLLKNKEIFAVLPVIIKDGELAKARKLIDKAIESGIKGFLCESFDALYEALKYNKPIVAGAGFGISNLKTIEFFEKMGVESAFLSPELPVYGAKSLAEKSNIPVGVLMYGRVRVMITENCLINAAHGFCACDSTLTDKTGAQFPILKHTENCRNVIYSHKITDCMDRLLNMEKGGISRFDISFTTENGDMCREILGRM